MSISASAGNSKAALKARRNDLYETPPVAVEALLDVESLPHCLWEPAAGPGSIVGVLRRRGYRVIATDLVDYGLADSNSARDFLMERHCPTDVEAIITNPPFKLASEFVQHALLLCPRVVMLLRLAFLESAKRTGILDGGQLARVHVFKNRLPMMHRQGWEGPRATSATAYAWFVWDRNHAGPTVLHRLSWRQAA